MPTEYKARPLGWSGMLRLIEWLWDTRHQRKANRRRRRLHRKRERSMLTEVRRRVRQLSPLAVDTHVHRVRVVAAREGTTTDEMNDSIRHLALGSRMTMDEVLACVERHGLSKAAAAITTGGTDG